MPGRYDLLLQKDQPKGDPLPKETPKPSTNEVQKPAPALMSEMTTVPAASSAPPVRPVLPVPPVRGQTKRIMRPRHPFDIYQDQYESLRDLSLQERMEGGQGSMSAMVRDALDSYIGKHRKK